MTLALIVFALAAYLGAAHATVHPARRHWEKGLALLAIALHGWALSRAVFADAGLVIGITEAMSLLGWQSAALLWLACLWQPLAALGALVYPLAALGGLIAALWPSTGADVSMGDWRLQLHIVLSIFSAGLLTLAAAQAVALASLERVLHRRQGGALARILPPLQVMERLLFQLIALGFGILSLALLTGLVFVKDLFGQHLV